MIRWGFYLANNSNRPYYEGHERQDVVEARNEFVTNFAAREHLYWQIENDPNDKEKCDWITPIRQEDGSKKVALFSHDESTCRRGEVAKKKWCFPGKELLYQNGRMQSVMQSWFILKLPIGPFFDWIDLKYI